MIGARVYEAPAFNSEVLSTLPVGSSIFIELVEKSDSLIIGAGFSLKGNWIRPKNIKGYVFSTDLTGREVEVLKRNQGISISLLGGLKEQKQEEKRVSTVQGDFPKYIEYRYYDNGTYTYTAWDGCFDHLTEYRNLSLSEVYHQMLSDYGIIVKGKEFSVPVFQEREGDTLKFQGEGAAQDLKIQVREGGIVVVSSYDCT